MIWDWQQIQDYEQRREALRQWLAQRARDDDDLFKNDAIMQEIRARFLRDESE